MLQQHFEAIKRVHQAGDGAMTLVVVNSATAATITVDAMDGDPAARVILRAGDRLFRQIDRRSRANALTCWLCSGALWRDEPPAAFGVLVPYDVEPVRATACLPFCADCTATHSWRELAQAAVERLRAEMMPGLRTFLPVSAVGHA